MLLLLLLLQLAPPPTPPAEITEMVDECVVVEQDVVLDVNPKFRLAFCRLGLLSFGAKSLESIGFVRSSDDFESRLSEISIGIYCLGRRNIFFATFSISGAMEKY